MAAPTLLRAAGARPRLTLALLLIVYVFNFVDRQILAILAAPIQRDLGLSDERMGLLGGLAFALLYSTLAVPLAWLADRRGRSRVIALALAIWSTCTMLCGMAQGFGQLFLARVGVGVGEAGGVAPSHALIAELFPSERRASALAIYSLGIPLGSAAGVLAGAAIAQVVDWRAAFVAVGLAGLVLAIPFKLLVRDPPRSAREPLGEPASLARTAAALVAKPAFWLLSLGAASGSTIGYGIAFWLPSLLQRSFHLGLLESAVFIAALLLTGGVAGMLLGGRLADRLGRRDRAFYAWVPALAYLVSVPLFAWAVWSPGVPLAFALLLVPSGLSYVWLGPVTAAVQHLVEPRAHATASALFLLINNLIGLGAGTYLLGALSTALAIRFGAESLRYALVAGLGCYVLAAVLMAFAGPALRRGWIPDDRPAAASR